jgi:hypothetical protein
MAQADWIALRWQAANGPRDVEFLRSSIRTDGGIVSVSLRRNRQVVFAQDPSIAPETNPWTSMEVKLDCVQRRWRQAWYVATDASGEVAGEGGSSEASWLPIQPQTLPEALRTRLCPSA